MTSDYLRQLAVAVAHDMPVSEVRDVIPGKLLEAAAELDALAERAVPEGYYIDELSGDDKHCSRLYRGDFGNVFAFCGIVGCPHPHKRKPLGPFGMQGWAEAAKAAQQFDRDHEEMQSARATAAEAAKEETDADEL